MADMSPSTVASTVATNVINCVTTNDCRNITNSVCEITKKICTCHKDLPVIIPKIKECISASALNTSCRYNEQCSHVERFSLCDSTKKVCVCLPEYKMKTYPDVGVNCVTISTKSSNVNMDPAMYGILGALILMFVIICVVLRLFSKARFRENRSIFNTPNPRLMNASLFKDRRRGSTLSTASAAGSTAGRGVRTPSPSHRARTPDETTVAIAAHD